MVGSDGTARSGRLGRMGGRLAALLVLCAALAAGATAAAPVVIGPPERVFDWASGRCARWDIADAPARAWRDATGAVRLIAGSESTRASAGATLDALDRDCAVLHRGATSGDPGRYDDRSWIAAVFTVDGRRVEALAHMEFHGHLRPELCPAAAYSACWMNAVTALVSEDGGRSFARSSGGDLVAALPYRYDGGHGRRAGYFNPSNILRDGDHLYAFVFAGAYGAQRRGPCLLRRPITGGAGDWRAWDGRAFAVRFASPYRERVADPAAHVCAPLAGLGATLSSVVRRAPGGGYLAVTPTTRRGPDGALTSGVYWTVSEDLIRWSEPELLLAAPLLWRRDCAAPAAFAYPSLIDPDSPSRNFDTVDRDFWLYLVEAPLDAACRIGPERNLIRYPVSWPDAAARPAGTPPDRRTPPRP